MIITIEAQIAGESLKLMAVDGLSWKIVPVSHKPDITGGFRWIWEESRDGAVMARSRGTFQYYNECVEDAKKRGYKPPPTVRQR